MVSPASACGLFFLFLFSFFFFFFFFFKQSMQHALICMTNQRLWPVSWKADARIVARQGRGCYVKAARASPWQLQGRVLSAHERRGLASHEQSASWWESVSYLPGLHTSRPQQTVLYTQSSQQQRSASWRSFKASAKSVVHATAIIAQIVPHPSP